MTSKLSPQIMYSYMRSIVNLRVANEVSERVDWTLTELIFWAVEDTVFGAMRNAIHPPGRTELPHENLALFLSDLQSSRR